MKRMTRSWIQWGAVAALSCGINLQLGSCTVDASGLVSGFVDVAGLQELQTALVENSALAELLEAIDESGDESAR
jgi:hypothetical protein